MSYQRRNGVAARRSLAARRVRHLAAEFLERRLLLAGVTSTEPLANATNAAAATAIRVAFDTPLAQESVTAETFTIHSSARGRLSSTATGLQVNDRTLMVSPAAPFLPGEVVKVTTTAHLLTTSREQVAAHVWEFRAASGSGTAIFSDAGQSLGNHASRSVALGDFDQDGDLDAFVANSNDQGNRVWENDGFGRFQSQSLPLGTASSYAVALGDLDGDGDLDAFVANKGPNKVWFNHEGRFVDSNQSLGDQPSYAVDLGDVDGDGDLDAFIGNYGFADRIWLNEEGVFRGGTGAFGDHATVGVALGDLDGDGDLDAFTAHDDFQPNRVWIGDGFGDFHDSGQQLGDHSSSSVTMGDLDGDGDIDAFVTNRNEGNQIWSNQDGEFAGATEIFGNANRGADFGDLDGDGDLDIFIANGGGQGSPVFRNNGFGTLSNTGQSLGNHSSTDAALGDLDGDGDLDAFLTNPFEQNRIWMNGTSPPPPPPPIVPFVTLSVDRSAIDEAEGSAVFTATLSSASSLEVTVELAFAGTASLGEDYAIANAPIVIPAGATEGTMTVTATQDRLLERTETIMVAVANVINGVEVAVQEAVTTILDDDEPPLVFLTSGAPEFAEDGGTAEIGVSLSTISGLDVTVDLSFTGTATLFADYLPPNPRVLIPAGEMSRTVTLTGLADLLDEDDETVVVEVSLAMNGREDGDQQETVRIIDDDASPPVTLTTSTDRISEGDGAAVLTASIPVVSGRDVVVDLGFTGAAEFGEGGDFAVDSTQIVIPAGATAASTTLTTLDDELVEPDEDLIVRFSRLRNGVAGAPRQQSITIVDDDRPPTVSLAVDMAEITEGGGVATFTVALAYAFKRDVIVKLHLGGSATPNRDYFAAGAELTIRAGSLQNVFAVIAIQDGLAEPHETVVVDIVEVIDGTEDGEQQATLTILDDDAPPVVTLGIADPQIAEAGGVTTIDLALASPYRDAVVITLHFAGTASWGEDYIGPTTEIVIAAGQRKAQLQLVALPDLLPEDDETIVVSLAEIENGVIGSEAQTVRIVDDDQPPRVWLETSTATLAENGGSAIVRAVLSGPHSLDVGVDLGFSGTATAGIDYAEPRRSLLVPAGSTVSEFALAALPDDLDEADETISVEMLAVREGVPAEMQRQTLIIKDDDPPPTVTLIVDRSQIGEQHEQATFFVLLSSPSGLPVQVDLSFSGTATAGVDFTFSATSIVIPAGITMGTVTVASLPDAEVEPDETVAVEIVNVVNGMEAGVQQRTARIVDSGPPLPRVDLNIAPSDIAERDGQAILSATLSAPASVPVEVGLAFSGTADVTTDFAISSDTILIQPGEQEGTIFLSAINDFAAEGDESVIVRIASISNAKLGETTSVAAVIKDDDQATVSLLTNRSTIAENRGSILLTAVLSRLAGDPGLPVTVELEYQGTATWGVDYAAPQRIVIPAGSLNATIVLSALPDSLYEQNETIIASIASITNASNSQAPPLVLTLTDDDVPPMVMLSVDVPSVHEGGSPATLTAMLSTPAGLPVTVSLGFSGSATRNADYRVPEAIVISAGSLASTVLFVPVDDSEIEGEEAAVVTAVTAKNGLLSSSQQVSVAILDAVPGLLVTALNPTHSGFEVEFNRRLDVEALNLYDAQTAGLGPADVRLVGRTRGEIRGSLVVGEDGRGATFVKSGGPLEPDEYTVTLRGGPNGFATVSGAPLSGAGNQTAGSDFAAQFTIASPQQNPVVVSLPDFVRAAGQSVHIPATARGIPLTLHNATELRSFGMQFEFDPSLLEITTATVTPGLPAGTWISLEHLRPGAVRVEFASSTALPSDPFVAATLQAAVPASASDAYRSQQVITVSSLQVRDASGRPLPSVGDDALHLLAFFGDASGNRRINASDAARLARFAALLDGGFAGFLNTDPLVAGDISGNGRINAADASLVARWAALIDVPEIPPLPVARGGLPALVEEQLEIAAVESVEQTVRPIPDSRSSELTATDASQSFDRRPRGDRERLIDLVMESFSSSNRLGDAQASLTGCCAFDPPARDARGGE